MGTEIDDINEAPPELNNEEAHAWLRGYNEAIGMPHEQKIDPYGLLVGHTWAEVGELLDLINAAYVTRFVELGVHVGGLTAVLSPLVIHKPGFRYLAVEINRGITTPTVQALPEVSFIWGDCLDPAVRHEVELFIKSTPNISFIYCDNDSKPKEFEFYAPILQPYDIIAVHDFGTEIFDADVDPVVDLWHLEKIELAEPTRIRAWRKQ